MGQTQSKVILTCPTAETPLSVLPHREYFISFLSPIKSLVLSRALKISDCKKTQSIENYHLIYRQIILRKLLYTALIFADFYNVIISVIGPSIKK